VYGRLARYHEPGERHVPRLAADSPRGTRIAGLVDNSRGTEKLLRQLVALVRDGRTFVHRSRPLYWNEVRRVRRLGRRYLVSVYGDSSPEAESFAELSRQAFSFLPARSNHVHKVEIIEGGEVLVFGGGEDDQVYHLNKLDWNNALHILIEAALKLRKDIGRHDHQPAAALVTTEQIQTSAKAEDIAALEGELLAFLKGPDQTHARQALQIAEAEAEAEFLRKRDAENWKRQSLQDELRPEFVPPGTPPPQDWAALEYAKTRLNAIAAISLRALGDALRPEGLVSYIERVIQSLCKLCVAKLSPYEDLLIHEEGLRRHFRNSISEWLRDRLIKSVPDLEAQAWQVYRDRIAAVSSAPAENRRSPEMESPARMVNSGDAHDLDQDELKQVGAGEEATGETDEARGPVRRNQTYDVIGVSNGRETGALENSSKRPAPADSFPQVLKTGKRRGRRANRERRDAIRSAINKHGDAWREHLGEIFTELDSQKVPLGDLQGMEIDLGDGQSCKASSWDDLDLAQGEQRRQIVDALRKYTD